MRQREKRSSKCAHPWRRTAIALMGQVQLMVCPQSGTTTARTRSNDRLIDAAPNSSPCLPRSTSKNNVVAVLMHVRTETGRRWGTLAPSPEMVQTLLIGRPKPANHRPNHQSWSNEMVRREHVSPWLRCMGNRCLMTSRKVSRRSAKCLDCSCTSRVRCDVPVRLMRCFR